MAPYINHFSFLQTISVLYMLVTVTCTGSSLSHNEECSALFQFKQSIIHQDDKACAAHDSHVFHSWDTSFDCCSWEGVACSNNHEYGHVIGLDLSGNSICGHINSNSTLFSLVHLQRLNLSGNGFGESQIPSEIARLKQLRSLDFSNCGFSGQIPNGISQLRQLSSLDLSRNSLLKLHSPSLKNLVQNLTGLEELHLSWVDVNSSVPHFLANFSSLRSIRLIACSLWDEFPATIFELPKLQVLRLAYNKHLTGSFPEFHKNIVLEEVMLDHTGFFGIVPESISHLKHLQVLSLTECNFWGRVPGSLSNMTQLTYLALGDNQFTGIVPSLVSLLQLDVLELNGNKFEKGRFPNWIGKLTKLSELYLSVMNINDEISPFLANLTKISVVGLRGNSLIGRIPSWLFNFTQLIDLDLATNQLQGPISSTFSIFRSFQSLDLGSNNFSGRVELDIFLGLNKLQTLSLGYNMISLVATNNYTNITTLPELDMLKLSFCNLKEFPEFLRFQNNLRTLILDHNGIDGLVPVWIWNNSRETLEYIDLSYNSITGFDQHPRSLQWRKLEGFIIAYNQLRGQLAIPPQTIVYYHVPNNNLIGDLPRWICKLKSLQLLDLSFNNMSGTLPSCLGSLSNLIALKIRRNNFQGKMMSDFMPGSLLEVLDLSENRFIGQLPRSLTNCTNLEIISLGDNSSDDIFPISLGSLPKLQVLVLRSNKFYGPVQGSTTVSSQYFPRLRIIDLSNNNFSGQLHRNYFQTWNAMSTENLGKSLDISSDTIVFNWTYTVTLIHKGVRTEYYARILNIVMAIDLCCNKFEGEIPHSLQDLRGLQSLNLSNNHFIGRILPSLGHLKNLEALDISRNELFGEIPQQLVQLGFLEIFNVSFNHLEGHIPQGKQFNTFDNNSYIGNPRLCGQPLSKECQDSKVSRLPSTSGVSESFFPSERTDWTVISCGVGSGLAIGIVIGNFLHTRYSDWFTKMKDRWVRSLHNTWRNQGGAIA